MELISDLVYWFPYEDPDSRDGRHLLLQTEFHGQREYRTSVLLAHRTKEEQPIPSSRILTGKFYLPRWLFWLDPGMCWWNILLGSTNGSLASLTILDEEAFKRLSLLQGQLMRNLQHMAALNPKAFRWVFLGSIINLLFVHACCGLYRIVRNDYVSKPLTRGILDGNLLAQYESLPINRQSEVTQQIGTDRVSVLRDWIELRGSWYWRLWVYIVLLYLFFCDLMQRRFISCRVS